MTISILNQILNIFLIKQNKYFREILYRSNYIDQIIYQYNINIIYRSKNL